jgi:hypothetical protein
MWISYQAAYDAARRIEIYVSPSEHLLTDKHGHPLGHVSDLKADPATSSNLDAPRLSSKLNIKG